MLDPDGNYLGLVQLEASSQNHFNTQPADRVLTKSQVDPHDDWKQHGEPLM